MDDFDAFSEVSMTGFGVNRDMIGAGLSKTFNVAFGLFNHEMRVKRQLCETADGFDNEGPDRDVRDKMAVHHVDMKPIAARLFHFFDFGRQMREVSRQ